MLILIEPNDRVKTRSRDSPHKIFTYGSENGFGHENLASGHHNLRGVDERARFGNLQDFDPLQPLARAAAARSARRG